MKFRPLPKTNNNLVYIHALIGAIIAFVAIIITMTVSSAIHIQKQYDSIEQTGTTGNFVCETYSGYEKENYMCTFNEFITTYITAILFVLFLFFFPILMISAAIFFINIWILSIINRNKEKKAYQNLILATLLSFSFYAIIIFWL